MILTLNRANRVHSDNGTQIELRGELKVPKGFDVTSTFLVSANTVGGAPPVRGNLMN